MDEDEANTKAILIASRFWVQKVAVPVLVAVGLAGNIITVMVLTRKRMRSSTNIYLTALALADIIYLIFGLLLSFSHYNINDGKYELYWKCFGMMNWLFNAASATSAWLAVSFTIERYIAVCYPMRGRVFCTERKAKSIITIIYVFCLLTTSSSNFEFTLVHKDKCMRNCTAEEMSVAKANASAPRMPVLEKPTRAVDQNLTLDHGEVEAEQNATVAGNVTCCKTKITVHLRETSFGQSPGYKNFRNWYSAVVLIIIPFVLIAAFNCILIRAVYLSKKIRRVMTNNQDNNASDKNEKRITIMLIAIVIIFLICNTPNALYCIYYDFYEPVTEVEYNISRILGNFFNLLVMINAPSNFIVYCLLSKKFRTTFMNILWDHRKAAATKMETETILLSKMKSSNRFKPYKHGLMKRNCSEYKTPRNLETQSLTSMPRSKSMMARPIGKAKSTDLNV